MAVTLTRIRTPWHGACIHDQWYFCAGTGFVPADKMRGVPNIFLWAVSSGGGQNLTVALDFLGRGMCGISGCGIGSTDPDGYVGGSGGAKSLDVWKAYENGEWTSSTTVDVYLRKSAASGVVSSCTHLLSTYNAHYSQRGPLTGPYAFPWQTVTRTPDFFITPPAAGCPTTLQYSVTFYDDGTWTVA